MYIYASTKPPGVYLFNLIVTGERQNRKKTGIISGEKNGTYETKKKEPENQRERKGNRWM